MADRFIEIEVHGEDKILAAMHAYEERTGNEIRGFINDLSQAATRILATTVPVGGSEYLLRHISREPATWFPGGAGGGGEWETVAGIKTGTSMHPWYVEFGTGIHYGTGPIYPTRGSALMIEKPFPELDRYGNVTRVKFRRWSRGQKGQHYFYKTWLDVLGIAETRLIRRDFRR
jgi:hypothetical protein